MFLDGQKEFEFGGQFFLTVQSIRKVYSSYTAVSVDCHSQGLDVVAAVGSAGEIRQVELDLVPPFVQTHRHSADERFDSGSRLVVRGSESSSHVFIVQDLHFEGEIFFELHVL